MKPIIAGLLLTAALAPTAWALEPGELYIDGQAVQTFAQTQGGTTYVSLRAMTQALLPQADIRWQDGQAVVNHADCTLIAMPGQPYLIANDRALYIPDAVQFNDYLTRVPVRVLAEALGASVDWDAHTGAIEVTSGTSCIQDGHSYYDADSLYWLSRIISAESQGESLLGKLAVGNVVLNRVESSDFPNNIHGVIFDRRWGGQFEPVHNGTIYNSPTAESVLAAKLVLDGAEVLPTALYFLAPALTDNHWTIENRTYLTTIGAHWFFQ